MLNDRRRILELALESLELKKKEIDEEIAQVRSQLQDKTSPKKPSPKPQKKPSGAKVVSKSARFTNKERLRRSQRMKEYWENWRKKKINKK
jgi:hypothetical protein